MTGDAQPGACLCGGVRFSGVPIPGRGVALCHCGICRRWGGGPSMTVRFADGVHVEAGDTLAWYTSSGEGERGFCTRCGTSLFWREPGEAADWALNVHALGDGQCRGLAIREHIFTADKPAFYDFADTAPRH